MMPDTSAFFLKRSDLFYTAVMSTCLFKAQDELHILKAWMDAFTVWQIVGIVKTSLRLKKHFIPLLNIAEAEVCLLKTWRGEHFKTSSMGQRLKFGFFYSSGVLWNRWVDSTHVIIEPTTILRLVGKTTLKTHALAAFTQCLNKQLSLGNRVSQVCPLTTYPCVCWQSIKSHLASLQNCSLHYYSSKGHFIVRDYFSPPRPHTIPVLDQL